MFIYLILEYKMKRITVVHKVIPSKVSSLFIIV